MQGNLLPLSDLPVGRFGIVKTLLAKDLVRRRLLDLGLIGRTSVLALRKSPSGDPTAYQIRGAVIALRKDEAVNILVEIVQ